MNKKFLIPSLFFCTSLLLGSGVDNNSAQAERKIADLEKKIDGLWEELHKYHLEGQRSWEIAEKYFNLLTKHNG